VAAWAPTRALGRAVLLTGVLVLLGVVLGRFDLVALAAPFALGTAWAVRRLPTLGPRVAVALVQDVSIEGGDVGVTITVANPDPVAFDLVVVRVAHSRWLRLRHGDRPYVTDLPGQQSTEIMLSGPALRWGRHEVGPAVCYAVACDGLLRSASAQAPADWLKVHPNTPPFRADDTMPRASGLIGAHRSRRPGHGGELDGVRRYGPGDRLRRIDWRVTLRTRELHVAQTLSDRDAEVVVLLDVLNEAGQSGGVHGAASVLDTTVRAAAAIAEHYLRQGDRVGLLEYSGHPRHLRAASGRRQLQTVLEWLLDARASEGAGNPLVFAIDPHLIPGPALVVVLTPLIAPESTEMIARLARAGRVVIAVDTLGNLAHRKADGSHWTALAQRLWLLERENTIGALREVGVPVAAWAGAGSLDDVLREMTRLAAAPRIGVR
jgi:uncharacterized protein (DUF58 family)